MARGKQTPQDTGGTEAIWAGSPMGASMISLRDTEATEARGHEGKELQLLGIPTQLILWLHGLEDLSSVMYSDETRDA